MRISEAYEDKSAKSHSCVTGLALALAQDLLSWHDSQATGVSAWPSLRPVEPGSVSRPTYGVRLGGSCDPRTRHTRAPG
jgi:hypothetical protein